MRDILWHRNTLTLKQNQQDEKKADYNLPQTAVNKRALEKGQHHVVKLCTFYHFSDCVLPYVYMTRHRLLLGSECDHYNVTL